MVGAGDAGDPRLLETILREIRHRGPIPFSRFMEMALYDAERGYYARADRSIGPEGDFFTASDVGTIFGECLARQLGEMDRALGSPDPFLWVEHGAGRGLLTRDVLDALAGFDPGLRSRLRPVLVDRSPAMRECCARAVPEAEVVSETAIPRGDGCVLAVELFDALPVRRVRRVEGRPFEIFVAAGPDGLEERLGDPEAETLGLLERHGGSGGAWEEAEVAPDLERQLARMQEGLARGFVLIVDYGFRAAELYGPAHRRGTLLAYHRHRTSEDYLSRVGEQDLTAHVNFTALERHARALGMDDCGFTTQDRFLVACGALEALEIPGDPVRAVRRRLHVRQLVHPEGMGRAFKVLLLSKGVAPRPDLAAMRDPFAAPRA